MTGGKAFGHAAEGVIAKAVRPLARVAKGPGAAGAAKVGARDMLGKDASHFADDLTRPLSAEVRDALGKTFDDTAPGPLDRGLASTFTDGRYTVAMTDEPRRFFRAGTETSSRDPHLGQFWSDQPPASVAEVRRDYAVREEWPDGGRSPLDTGYDVEFEPGTVVYYGEVAPQGPGYPGGAMQYLIQKPWDLRPKPAPVDHWPLRP